MSSRPVYETPSLQRHRSGTMNKMGGIPALRPISRIEGVEVEDLVANYGSPLFVYSERSIVERYQQLRDQLERRWPKVQLAWSYKTCYLDAICRIYHREGSWAEAVSDMEVEKALRNGVPMDQVIFNGPHKTDASILAALRGGAKVNLDNFDEMARVEKLSEGAGLEASVGLRLNLAAGSIPRWDRFGFNLDSGQAWDAVRRMLGAGKLRLAGLHCHLGTFILDTAAYGEATKKIVAFANRLKKELGIVLEYIDLGGGFASKARLKSSYLPPEEITPSASQYAEAIGDALGELDYSPDQLPTLFLETGRGLIDEAGTLIATVLANKRLADGRRAVVLDAGVNLLYTSTWYRHEVVPTAPTSGAPEPTVLFGPLCMNIDVVGENLMLPPLEVGSRVLIRPVGAYNVTQSMQFIHLRPAVVLVGQGGQVGVIRRAETLEDLTIGEQVPEWIGR